MVPGQHFFNPTTNNKVMAWKCMGSGNAWGLEMHGGWMDVQMDNAWGMDGRTDG